MNNLIKSTFPSLFPTEYFKDIDSIFQNLFDWKYDYKSNNNKLFDSHTGSMRLNSGFPKGSVFVSKEGNLIMEFGLAGYSKDQLSVMVENDNIVISAQKSLSGNEQNNSIFTRQWFKKAFSDYAKMWNLEMADVSYKDGLLIISIPPFKKETKQAKQLLIK